MKAAPRVALLFCVCAGGCTAILGDFQSEVVTQPPDASVHPDVGDDGGSHVEAAAGEDASFDGGADAGEHLGGEGGSLGEAGVAPCDPQESPPAYGAAVYVSQQTGQADASGASGRPSSPYKTINDALGPAKALQATTLVLDEGTYAERVDLANFTTAIRLDGAWIRTGAVWTRDCGPDRSDKTLIQSPDVVGITVSALPMGVTLSNLAVYTSSTSAPVANAPGSSPIALVSKNSIVSLSNVHLVAADATSGGAASAGSPGTAACQGSLACVAQPKPGADRASAAAATTAGTFSAAGFAPSNGQPGAQSGGQGDNGAPGSPGSSRNDCEVNGRCDSVGSTCHSVAGTVSSQPGQCGCGGTGGGPGAAGEGGGASAAIVASGGTISVKYSELIAGNGGDGAQGGAGGAGGTGSPGVAGAAAACWTPGCGVCGTCPNCGCYAMGNWDSCTNAPAPTDRLIAGGPSGGGGAIGGRGEGGGPGAGGPSFAYVPLDGAQVLLVESQVIFGHGGSAPTAGLAGGSGEHP